MCIHINGGGDDLVLSMYVCTLHLLIRSYLHTFGLLISNDESGGGGLPLLISFAGNIKPGQVLYLCNVG